MAGTRWRALLRSSIGSIHREFKITMTALPKPKKWVFIVGCYNSGTTLLHELLSTHKQISGLPTEGQFLTDQFDSDYQLGLPRMWVQREDLFRLTEKDNGPDAIRIKKEWAIRLEKSKPIYLEKTPPNAARTRWLQKHFENAYFIGIVRNGYAVSEGIARKAEPKHLKDGWPIELCAYQWHRSNEILSEDAKYLNNFIWVKYEDLAENAMAQLERIFRFLDIKSELSVDLEKNWSIHERDQKIMNMNSESISKLSSDKIAIINSIAKDTLRKFDYTIIAD